MAYDNTKVPTARSQEAIRRLVMSNGGTGVAFVSQPPLESFQAQMPMEGKTYTVRIIARLRSHDEISAAHHRSSQARINTLYDQEERRVWRVLFYHLKSLFEAAASGVLAKTGMSIST